MNHTKRRALLCAALMLGALTACTSTRSGGTADIKEMSSAAESSVETTAPESAAEETEVTTEATTVTEAETTEAAAETTAEASQSDESSVQSDSSVKLTHITEGGEGLGVFAAESDGIRGEEMTAGSEYKNWKLESWSGTPEDFTATFVCTDSAGFSVNGTVEVLPSGDKDAPGKMDFHSDDVDAFPRFMEDNRGEDRKAKFVIENSSEVYKMLGKEDPPAENAFAVSVTISTVTVRYTSDGSARDTVKVTAASNR
ncbi:MAG: hypothetical protein MJ065_02950 [Oscillospiraceae bacterium]|nr:hypothetical protein [Oscillospiraceae bacterium]